MRARGVNELNFNSLPMLGRVSSETVQGLEGNRQSLPNLGSHAEHDFRGLEDGNKPDTRAVRVAVCAMTACRGLIVKAVGRNVSGGNNGGAVGRCKVFLLLFARARILILSSRKPEPASRNASSFAGGYGGQVAGQGRREAANDRPANGGQFGKLAEGVMMGSERKRARPVFAQTLRRGKQGT